MLFKLRSKVGRSLFNYYVREVLRLPAVETDATANLIIVSQVQHKDLMLYLVAIKTFTAYVSAKRVVVVNDGTLSRGDLKQLEDNVSGIEIVHSGEFALDGCPVGGCWERLIAIANLNKDGYVIQLDSDVLTLIEPTEVIDHVANGTSYTIGTWTDQEIEPMANVSELIRKERSPTDTDHVQLVAEAAFLDLEECGSLKYVRGCAGFSGFAPGSVSQTFIADTSRALTDLIGAKWSTWGSEQVMSNLVVANSPNAGVLPHPAYSDCKKMTPSTKLIHFIGECRFDRNRYGRMAASKIRALI